MNQQLWRNCEICHGFPDCAKSSYLYLIEEISHNKTREQLAPARIVSIAVDVQIYAYKTVCKVKQGNLERKLDFGTCCLTKFCSKSKTMFVCKVHLSTVKASKSCLTLLLYLECTAD